MYCQKCGKQLPDDANFCSNCGQAVKTNLGFTQSPVSYDFCTIKLNSGIVNISWEAVVNKRSIAKVVFAENPFGNMVSQRREKNLEIVSQLS